MSKFVQQDDGSTDCGEKSLPCAVRVRSVVQNFLLLCLATYQFGMAAERFDSISSSCQVRLLASVFATTAYVCFHCRPRAKERTTHVVAKCSVYQNQISFWATSGWEWG